MSSPIKVGIIGYGNSARSFHLPYILSIKDLHVIAFLQPTAAPSLGTQPAKPHCTVDYPQCKHYRQLEPFLADEEIDLVVILTNHDTHAEFAEKALLAGKHVVVEKPFSRSTEEADRVLAAQKKSGKVLVPFQNRRYDSDYQTVQSLISQDVFGEILDYTTIYDVNSPSWATSPNPGPYTPGDGMMFGIGVHKFDQVLHLFGRPSTITAFIRSLRPGITSPIEDSYDVILRYSPDGPNAKLIVTVKTNAIQVSRAYLAYVVNGREGSFTKFGEDVQERQTSEGMKRDDEGFGWEPESTWGTLTTREKVLDKQVEERGVWVGKVPSLKGDYANYYQDVVNAVRGGDVVIQPQTSRDGIRLCELARESAESGRTVNWS